MAMDAYSSCPCGSGKKFKWCCQPLYAQIDRAFEQDAQGQHDAALRIMDELTAQHADNPEAWGQKAKLLYAHGKVEQAEEALEKAFALNRNYPYGLLLRAVFRYQEGEIAGALLLARRAADAYDPEARDYIAEAYSIVYECEMKLNRPVAGRAALRIVLRSQPAAEEVREAFDQVFGENSRLPAAARREYALMSPAAGARRTAWDRALQAGQSPRLGELVRAFDELTKEDASDAAAWYDLGLARAWFGDNAGALDALNHYLELEADEAKATTAAALTELLRCGQGMEEACDYHEYSFAFQFRDPQPIVGLVQEWQQAGRLMMPGTQQEGVLFAMILELTTASLITVGRPAADVGRLGAYLLVAGPVFRMWGPNKDAVGRVREEVRGRLQLPIGEAQEIVGPIQFHDVATEALVFPTNMRDPDAGTKVVEHAQRYYEETWIQQPRRSLAGNAPVDAAGHANLRKKLRGVVQFIQECAHGSLLAGYDFDRLRRKLGLIEGGAAAAAAPASAATTTADVGAMGAAELAGLKAESLSDEQLEQAFHAAQKLDAGDLAAHFVRTLTGRPPRPEHTDRFAWYAYLTQHALKNGQLDQALDYVNEGERVDCEQNEGRRRNDYELRRGQVHVKRGEADAAADVYQRLIERAPDDLKYRGSAAEAMLSLKQGARALRFAEDGLALARQRGDRDSEQYLQELAGAAKRQGA